MGPGDTEPLNPAEPEAGELSQDFQIHEPPMHSLRLGFLSLSSGRILSNLLIPSPRNSNQQLAEGFNNYHLLMFTKSL